MADDMVGWREQLLSDAPDAEIARRVASALDKLLRTDAFLFEADANERSISHKLATYLEVEFAEWDVDCEYNRDGFEPKRLHLRTEQVESDDTEGTTVYPDIIVHRRGRQENLIALEIKKTTGGPADRDLEKLFAFRSELKYQFVLFIRFETLHKCGVAEIRWTNTDAG